MFKLRTRGTLRCYGGSWPRPPREVRVSRGNTDVSTPHPTCSTRDCHAYSPSPSTLDTSSHIYLSSYRSMPSALSSGAPFYNFSVVSTFARAVHYSINPGTKALANFQVFFRATFKKLISDQVASTWAVAGRCRACPRAASTPLPQA